MALILIGGSIWASSAEHGLAFKDQVWEVGIKIDLQAQRQLADAPDRYVRGELQIGDKKYSPVGIRLRPQVQTMVPERRPSFMVKVDEYQSELNLDGIREFIVEESVFEMSLFERFAAARLATMMAVPCPEYGHARVSLNGRPLGVYFLIEASNRDLSARWTGRQGGELLDAARLDEAVKTLPASHRDEGGFLERVRHAVSGGPVDVARHLDDIFDLDQVYRFLAWETFVRNTSGYSHSRTNGWVVLGGDGSKARLASGTLYRVFSAPRMSVLGGKQSDFSKLLLGDVTGRRRFLNALAAVATNSVMEADLVREIEQRMVVLTPYLGTTDQMRSLSKRVNALEGAIKGRFEMVRKEVGQLIALNDRDLAAVKIPVTRITDYARPEPLPVSGSTKDYASLFGQLLEGSRDSAATDEFKVTEISLEAPNGLLEGLSRSDNRWVNVTAVCDGQRFENTGLRLKGKGSRDGFRGRPTFTLKFDQENPGRRYKGSSKIHIQNTPHDASLLNHFVGAWVCRRAGVPSPKSSFVRLTVNGVNYGVFAAVDGVTKDFLKQEFGDPSGLLFEGEHQDINGALDVDSGTVPPGYGDLQQLYATAKESLRINSALGLTNVLNLDQFARFAAVEMVLGHSDGYLLAANNYRLYQHPNDGRFQFIPHGMDRLLMGQREVFPKATGILGQALFSGRDGQRLYAESLRRIVTESVDMSKLVNDAAKVCREIQVILKRDDPLQAPAQLASARGLIQRFDARLQYLREQVEKNPVTEEPTAWSVTARR